MKVYTALEQEQEVGSLLQGNKESYTSRAQRLVKTYKKLLSFLVLLAVTASLCALLVVPALKRKTGAGLLLVDANNRALLLFRNSTSSASQYDAETWGLPGGERDRQLDATLYETAVRKATEELGVLPNYTTQGLAPSITVACATCEGPCIL